MAPKCPKCDKSAYPAESISLKNNTYHKGCFKCSECSVRLTLTTYKVSDFGQDEIFCAKCVPKQAPSQAAESVEGERVAKASKMNAEVGMVNEQVRLDNASSDNVVKATEKPDLAQGVSGLRLDGTPKSPSMNKLRLGGTPKCPVCTKSAYPAESVTLKGQTFHKACFKCSECSVRLTLTTYKVSDFGQDEIFCAKCVPKQAPSQAAESLEGDRAAKASKMTAEVRMVNEQVRGDEETLGQSTSAVPT